MEDTLFIEYQDLIDLYKYIERINDSILSENDRNTLKAGIIKVGKQFEINHDRDEHFFGDKNNINISPIKEKEENTNLCPICGQPAIHVARRPQLDSKCKNGHKWHTCTIHHVKVIGDAPFNIQFKDCSCLKK